MTNQLPIPQSSNFKGDMKAAYDAIYPLYGILFGSDQYEIPVHLSGSLLVDNDITVNSSLNVVDWKIDVTGDDLRFRDDGLVERFRLGDNSSTYAALVTGDLKTTTALTINDWKGSVSGDDLIWVDDGGVEKVRFGDSSSTFALTATGDLKTTTAITINDWKASVSGDDLVWVDDAGSEMVRFGDTSSTYHLKVTGPAQVTGLINIGGNIEHTSSGAAIGFFNSTPNTKQTVTGSRGGNAALASLLSALANYGLVTDSSS